MRKWTYLVAALLLGGTTATFTGCIDNDEPAGITELRGAKAELLRAKAAVQMAEAAIKNAQAACLEADALWKAEKAAQEKIQTEINAAKGEQEKAYWQQEAQKSAEAFNAEMYKLQAVTAQEKLKYEQALAQVELALTTYKDNIYATALNDLMFSKSFEYKEVTYTESNGNITSTSTSKSITGGLQGLAKKLANTKDELTKLMRQKSLLEFSYDPEALITGVTNQVAVEEGKVAAIKENLADLKVVAETPLADFEAKYKEISDKKDAIDKQIAALDVTKANDADYQAALQKEEQINKDKAAKGEFTFAIPAPIQNSFKSELDDIILALPAAASTTLQANLKSIQDAAVQDRVTGEYSFPNSFRLSLTLENKDELLAELIDGIKDKVLTPEELATEKGTLAAKKIDNDVLQAKLAAATTAWTKAYNAYKAAYDAGKYASEDGNDARSLIMADYDVYQDAVTAANGDAVKEKAALDAFVAKYKTYFTNRTKLDGLELDAAVDITKDATKFAAWDALTEAEKYGVSDLTNVSAGDETGLAGALWQAADEIGYTKDCQTVVTYAEWLEAPSNTVTRLISGGLAENTFAKQEEYEDASDKVNNAADWTTLNDALLAMQTTNDDALAKLVAAQQEVNVAKAKVEEKYAAEKSKLEVQKAGMQDIMTAMAGVVTDVNYTTYDAAIANIKAQITAIEGAPSTTDPSTGNITVGTGTLAQAQAQLNMYTKLLAALKDGSYEQVEASAIKLLDAQITSQKDVITVLTALFTKASAQKDALLANLTGSAE